MDHIVRQPIKMTSAKLRLVPLLAIGLGAATANAQATDPMEELKACAKIEDAGARAECYDTLGKQVLNEESGNTTAASEAPEAASVEVASEAAAASATVSSTVVAATPEAEPEPEPEPETEAASGAAATAAVAAAAASTEAGSAQPIPDDVGGQRFEENTDEKYLDHVVSCDKNSEGKWVFTFKSGQVWKQVSSRRVVLDDDACQFNATVSKDFFGYKMQIEGEKGKIRISRLK
jgi:hypothetical protein